MDFSLLPKLGKVAGLLGVAIGAVALIVNALLARFDLLPEVWRGPLFLALIVASIILIGLAILSWARASRPGAQIARTEGDNSSAQNKDKTKGGSSQDARTKGNNAPAINERG